MTGRPHDATTASTTTPRILRMNRFPFAFGLLVATAVAAVPAFAADSVVVPAPAASGVVVKRTTEVTSPSAEAAASSVRRAARKASAAAHRTVRKARARIHEATRPATRTEKTTTTVDTGSGNPVVVTKEKKTTH
jgi:hypothetical protein